jgi:hypothetical protein
MIVTFDSISFHHAALEEIIRISACRLQTSKSIRDKASAATRAWMIAKSVPPH